MADKKELSKDDKIKKEMLKLKKIFKDISKDRKSLCENLIKNAAFMSVTLEELQEDINIRGTVIVATNGNGFRVTSENPSQKSYNVMISRYTAIIKQLEEMLPDLKTESTNRAGEALASFVTRGKPGARK